MKHILSNKTLMAKRQNRVCRSEIVYHLHTKLHPPPPVGNFSNSKPRPPPRGKESWAKTRPPSDNHKVSNVNIDTYIMASRFRWIH